MVRSAMPSGLLFQKLHFSEIIILFGTILTINHFAAKLGKVKCYRASRGVVFG
jgi:hypothetical protein